MQKEKPVSERVFAMPNRSIKPKFHTIPRVAARWGVSRYTVRQSIRHGQLRAVCLGRRLVIPVEEVERIEKSGKAA
jgi:excisionase family DNA binding protein